MSAELGGSMPRKAGPDRFLGDARAAPGAGHEGLLDADDPVRCSGRVPGLAGGDHGPELAQQPWVAGYDVSGR